MHPEKKGSKLLRWAIPSPQSGSWFKRQFANPSCLPEYAGNSIRTCAMDEAGDKANLPGAAASGSQRRVFISYATHDAAVAQKVCSALETAGFLCWIAPRNVVPGTLYADGIVHAIDDSSILVLILSEQAVASAHVGREIERAVSKRHPVVVLRIDTAPLTPAFEYFLNQSQWIEGGGSDSAIAQLVDAVGQHLAPGTAGSPNIVNQASAVHRKGGAPPRGWVIAAIVVAVLLAGGYFVDEAWHSKHETTASNAVISDKSIAVLPFVDMSERKDQEYFADGMAEEIIDLLVKVPGLKVISRTSSFQFKGKTEDLRAIGMQLGVAYVLEGSVRKSGDRVRVTAQLINSTDGSHRFSQTYDRDFSDVLKMQDEIATALVRALQIEVSSQAVNPRPTLVNTRAYTFYLQGLHEFDSNDQQGFEQALSRFQQALDLDPSFAEAASMLASSYFVLGQFGLMPPAVAFEKARQAAQRAIELSPNLAAAHANLAEVYRAYDRDWPAADREIRLARSLAPNDPDALFIAAVQAQNLGNWDDALKFVNASLAQDPLSPPGYMVLNLVQLGRGRLEEAEAAIRRTIELNPSFTHAYYLLTIVLLARGQAQSALMEIAKETQEPSRLCGSAMAYFAVGNKANSDKTLAQMVKSQANHPYYIAQALAFRGDTDEAFKWLDRAYLQHDPGLAILKSQAKFMKIDGDPRYEAFLKKMNLPE
jgi:TolB-like protein/Flp pilus assembly protein TadD